MTTIAARSKTTKKRMAEKSEPASKAAPKSKSKAPKPQVKVKDSGIKPAAPKPFAKVAVKDERLGKSWDLPVLKGTVGPDVIDVRKLYTEHGYFTYDPGYGSTGSTQSSITYIDGDEGILTHRGYRIEDLAAELHDVLPQGRVTVCRELTKQFEDIATLDVGEMPAWLKAHAHRQKGEFVLVVHAVAFAHDEATLPTAMASVLQELVRHIPVKQAAGLVADATGLPRKAVYDMALAFRTAERASDED